MYILKVIHKKDKSLYFQKEYKTFEELYKKFKNIDFESDNYLYSIYKEMSIYQILKDSNLFDEFEKIIAEM